MDTMLIELLSLDTQASCYMKLDRFDFGRIPKDDEEINWQ